MKIVRQFKLLATYILARQRQTVKSGLVILIGAVAMFAGSVLNSSSMFLFVEGAIVEGSIMCSPQGNGKTYCCASVRGPEDFGSMTTTWCTMCDDTNPPSNCTPREKPKAVSPGRDLSTILEGGTLPTLNQTVSPRAAGVAEQFDSNLTFSQANLSSGNTSSNILSLEQSDTEENSTRTVNVDPEIDKGSTTDEGDNGESDEDNNNEQQNGNGEEEDNAAEDESASE